MTAVRDVLALWLMFLIVGLALGVSGVAVCWVVHRFLEGRRDRAARAVDPDAPTVILPRQRAGSR